VPQKRDVFAQLSRDELNQVVERFELAVTDRRKRDGLIEVIAASKKATLGEILPVIPRERLKELCRVFDLDDSGREKSTLIERLTATGKTTSTPSRPPRSNAKTGYTIEILEGELLTREKLEGYLWSAADILRRSIDSLDYKNHILGLLILK
jgi:type I restriction enzyme M protein